MRNLKKLLAVIVTIAIIATMAIPAFAETATKTDAQIVTDLGMLKGAGDGVTAEYLATQPDRLQAAILFLRLLGKEAEAKAYTGTDNFADAKGLSAENTAILAYLKANPSLGYEGIGDNKFDPLTKITAKAYYKVMLVALGYKYGTDFTWDNVMSFAAGKGLSKNLDVDTFKVNDLAVATVEALKAKVNGKDTTLVAQIADANATFKAAAQADGLLTVPVIALAVESVTANNLKEITIKFNKEVDATTAGTPGNYVFTTAGTATMGTAALQADKKTVILTLAAAATNQEVIAITVKNVKDAATGTAITTASSNITMFDTTIPEALSYKFTGPQTIEVTYSEPINAAGAALIDNGIYGATTALSATKNNVVIVTLGTSLPAGAHTLKISGVVDFVPYTQLAKVFDITYAADTTSPTVSVLQATQTAVTLSFSKEVKGSELIPAFFYHTFTAYAPAAITDALGVAIVPGNYYDTVVLDFSNRPLPSGTVNVVVLKTVGAASITDRWGNKLASDAVIPVTIAADTTAPTITKVEAISESVVVITYSEAVTGAATKANYVFKDSTGATIASTKYNTPVYNAALHTATVTFTPALTGGAYSVTVANIKDTSLSANALATTSAQAFTVSDLTAVSSATMIGVENAGTTADVIYITYPENMSVTGVNSVLSASNYQIGATAATATALPAGSTIELFGTNNKVKITMPGTGGADITAKNIYVRNIADASGNVTTALYIQVNWSADAAPAITAIKTVALNKLELTVNKPLSTINASNIKVDGNGDSTLTAVAQATYVNNADGTATITVILNAADVLPNEGAKPTELEITAGGLIKSITGTAMAANATVITGGVTPTDGIIPALAATSPVTTYDTNHNGKIDTVVIEYTEPIMATTVSLLTYSVAGYVQTAEYTITGVANAAAAATAVPAGANGKYVVIKVTEVAGATVFDTGATPDVTQLSTIADAAANLLPAQAAKAATDTAAPIVVKAIIGDATSFNAIGDTLTLTFSEAIALNFASNAAPTAAELDAIFAFSAGAFAGGTYTASISGNELIITAVTAPTIAIANTATLDTAAAPTANDIEDAAGNDILPAATHPTVNVD